MPSTFLTHRVLSESDVLNVSYPWSESDVLFLTYGVLSESDVLTVSYLWSFE